VWLNNIRERRKTTEKAVTRSNTWACAGGTNGKRELENGGRSAWCNFGAVPKRTVGRAKSQARRGEWERSPTWRETLGTRLTSQKLEKGTQNQVIDLV